MANVDKVKIEQAVEASEKFSKLFYETYDKRRHTLGKIFYHDSAVLVWNGNHVDKATEIQKFLEALPGSSIHLESLDAQPMPNEVSGGETSIMVTTAGSVKYDGQEVKLFNESFILMSMNNVWKIISDTIRTFD